MPAPTRFDVVVVGASIAGCTAARLFAIAGARVAVVERKPDPAAYKVACTHQIQSSAVPTIERLGLAPLLDARGAVRAYPETWSPHGGWIRFPADAYGYGVTRRTLDPMLRELAAGTPGVELMLGQSAIGLREEGGRITGVEIENPAHDRRSLTASLVVGADGRDSRIARLARLRGRVRPNSRFAYFAYWRGARPRSNRARIWFLDPEVAALFPNEDDLSLIAVVPHRSRLAAFRADTERGYGEMVARLPGGPDLDGAERVSKLIGSLDAPNVIRPVTRPGLALVGDAALTADPVFGVGCGWAFQTAEWLVDQTSSAVLGDGDLERALGRDRRRFRRRLWPHYAQISDYSSGRKLRLNERTAFRAAAVDPVVARAVEEVATRRRSPLRMFDPAITARALWRARSAPG